MSSPVAVFPGTFDPITFGHLDLIERASKIFDHLIIGVAVHTGGKSPLFTLEERVSMVEQEVAKFSSTRRNRIEVKPLKGLLIRFAQENGAKTIVRGLRAVSDFEYEFKMTAMNARLAEEIETVFLMASERQQFTSSIFVKEVGKLGGDISSFVSENVKQALLKRFSMEKDGD